MSKRNRDKRQNHGAKKPPTHYIKLSAGAKKLGPGVYVDKGSLIVSVPDILDYFGMDDTAENRDECLKAVKRLVAERFGRIPGETRAACPQCYGAGRVDSAGRGVMSDPAPGCPGERLAPGIHARQFRNACPRCHGSGQITIEADLPYPSSGRPSL